MPSFKNQSWCQLIFHFLQFKIHLNLLTDGQFEIFFENCKEFLISSGNKYSQNKKMCSNEIDLIIDLKNEREFMTKSEVFSRFLFFLFIIMLIFVILVPVFHLIFERNSVFEKEEFTDCYELELKDE